MSRRRQGVEEVRAALDAVVDQDVERVDRRAVTDGMTLRYTEHGECACLAAHILHRLGLSIGKLKEMDRAAGGLPIALEVSKLRSRFTPLAFKMLCHVQQMNDRGLSWGEVRKDTLSITDSWARISKYRYRGKEWLAETPALNAHKYESRDKRCQGS